MTPAKTAMMCSSITTAKLVGEDDDKAYDVYDAHVCTARCRATDAGLAAAVRFGRFVQGGALAAAGDLRPAAERDVQRRGERRAAAAVASKKTHEEGGRSAKGKQRKHGASREEA